MDPRQKARQGAATGFCDDGPRVAHRVSIYDEARRWERPRWSPCACPLSEVVITGPAALPGRRPPGYVWVMSASIDVAGSPPTTAEPMVSCTGLRKAYGSLVAVD